MAKPRKPHKWIFGIECKWCWDCKCYHSLDKFYSTPNTWDHLRNICKKKLNARAVEYNRQHPEKKKAREKIYRTKNKARIKKNKERYRTQHYERYLELARQYKAAHPKKIAKYQAAYFEETYARFLEIIDEYKTPCLRCGNPDVVFHHKDPDTKLYSIAHMWSMPKEKIRAELEKCECLCVSCHVKLHWQWRKGL